MQFSNYVRQERLFLPPDGLINGTKRLEVVPRPSANESRVLHFPLVLVLLLENHLHGGTETSDEASSGAIRAQEHAPLGVSWDKGPIQCETPVRSERHTISVPPTVVTTETRTPAARSGSRARAGSSGLRGIIIPRQNPDSDSQIQSTPKHKGKTTRNVEKTRPFGGGGGVREFSLHIFNNFSPFGRGLIKVEKTKWIIPHVSSRPIESHIF